MRSPQLALVVLFACAAQPSSPDGGGGGGGGGGPVSTMRCAVGAAACGAEGKWYLPQVPGGYSCVTGSETIAITSDGGTLCASYGPYVPQYLFIDGCTVTFASSLNGGGEIWATVALTLSFDGGTTASGRGSDHATGLISCNVTDLPIIAYRGVGEACDPLASQSCNPGQGCYDGLDGGRCAVAGGADAGEPCAASTECFPGNGCNQDHCAPYCALSDGGAGFCN